MKMEKLCRIRDLQRAISLFEGHFEKLYGICLNEGMLLCSLAKSGQLSSGEIAELLGLTTSNASKVIKAVEGKEFVERVMGREDKRQMYFSLTRKGKKLLSEIECNNIELSGLLKSVIEE